jgi:hypothetical protein
MKQYLLFAILLLSGAIEAQVANDEPAQATILYVNTNMQCSQIASGTLTGATASMSSTEGICVGVPDDDIWFRFSPQTTACHLTINTLPVLPEGFRAVLHPAPGFGNFFTPKCLTFINGVAHLNNLIPDISYLIQIYSQSAGPQAADVSVCITTPPPIIINTNYTAEQMVEDVLINSGCAQVFNITSSGSSNFNMPNSIGAFEQGSATFPFDRGIMLSTGPVEQAVGPNTSVQSNNPSIQWPGDSDLQVIMGGQPAPLQNFDATVLEFDFVPTIDNISFDFLFASEEYGQYQCQFGDAFAFILTDLTTGIKTNLAVIPGTATPVAVTTVNNSVYNTSANQCPSSNPEYFGAYYGNPPATLTAPVDFNGVTVPLTARSQVIPGQQYHIKLVIANKTDHLYNSAVFIDAATFNIGGLNNAVVEFNPGNSHTLCDTATLSINSDSDLNYQWYKDTQLIEDANENYVEINEPGTYTINVTIPGNADCSLEISTQVFDGGTLHHAEVSDQWIYEPESDGTATFNFGSIANEITEGNPILETNFFISYEDAFNNYGGTELPLQYNNINNPQTVYLRTENIINGCYGIKSFQIGVADENFLAPIPTGSTNQSFTEGETLADLDVQGENIQWYDNPGNGEGRSDMDTNDEPLPLTTPLVDGGTYYATQTLFGRESIERLGVTVHLMLGTEENQLTQLKFYPNPVIDVFTLSNTGDIDKFEVYSVVGQVVRSGANTGNTITINMTDMVQGVYLVKIYSGKQTRTLKVLKK